jgi:membrane fusion protein (multidrug efflux system)
MRRLGALLCPPLAMVLVAWPVCAQKPAAGPPPAKVVVSAVTEKEIAPTSRMLGGIDFDAQTGLSPEVSGLVESVRIAEGQVVREGAVIVKMNTDFVEKDIQILQQQVAQVEIKLENTRRNLNRYETLLKENVTSEKVYEDQSDSLRELEVQKQILVKQIEKKQLELEKSAIRAPFDGMVLKKHGNRGEWITPGDPVCVLAALDSTMVTVAVSEKLVRFVHPGQILSLRIPALQKSIDGEISALVPVADPKSKTFLVKVAVGYFEGAMQNMTAEVNVPVQSPMTLKMVKRDALVRFQGKDFVYTVKDGLAQMLPVKIAAVSGADVGVDAPHIAAGMPVVVDGNERLRPNQPVVVIEKR